MGHIFNCISVQNNDNNSVKLNEPVVTDATNLYKNLLFRVEGLANIKLA